VFGYLTGRGVPQLRTALAGYLNRVRGTVAEPARLPVMKLGTSFVVASIATHVLVSPTREASSVDFTWRCFFPTNARARPAQAACKASSP
jgi:aspartate/methionine/tyrosine aminotransferase